MSRKTNPLFCLLLGVVSVVMLIGCSGGENEYKKQADLISAEILLRSMLIESELKKIGASILGVADTMPEKALDKFMTDEVSKLNKKAVEEEYRAKQGLETKIKNLSNPPKNCQNIHGQLLNVFASYSELVDARCSYHRGAVGWATGLRRALDKLKADEEKLRLLIGNIPK